MNVTDIAANQFLKSYAKAWGDNDPHRISGHWDPSDRSVFYKAEEIERVLTSWPDIMAYWTHNRNFHDRVRLDFSPVTLRPLAPPYTLAIVPMRWDIAFATGKNTFDGEDFSHGGKAMGGINHVLAMIKHTPDGLKLTGWSETPDAPITYMARLYEMAASTDFKKAEH